MPAPLVVTALKIEHDALRAPCAARRIRLRCLGPGPACAERLDLSERPSFVLVAGLAGGLVRDPAPRTSVVIDGATGDAFTPIIAHDPRGNVIVSTDEPVCTPDEKRRLADAHGAHLVDNETGAIARRCAHEALPWGVLRVVSDGPDETLPRQAKRWIDERGGTRVGRVLLDTLGHPALAGDLRRLAKNTKRALRGLVPLVEQCLDDHD